MHVLIQNWQRTWARFIKSFKPGLNPSSNSPELQRSITSVTREYQSLAADLQRFRIESEQAGLDQNLKIGKLEAASQEASSARTVQAKQLGDLDHRVAELEVERHQSSGLVKSLEASLTDVLVRLDTLDKQARLFYAATREQEKVFEASLSLAITRQDTTDSQLETFRNTTLQQVKTLESSQADNSQRITSLGTSLADTSTRLEKMSDQASTLEQKLDLEHQLYLHTVKEVQSQVHAQAQRLNWTIMAAVCAMLLGSVAGGILVRDVQKNAGILGDIHRELEQLDSAIARYRIIGPSGTTELSARLRAPGQAEHRVAGEPPRSDP